MVARRAVMTRTLEELVSEDSAWPVLLDWVEASSLDVEIIEADPDSRAASLLAAQVTTHSMLGALLWNCGAVSIDHGWIRLLGAGAGSLDGAHPQRLHDPRGDRMFDGVVVAYDVLGGRFAIHGGGLDAIPPGEVIYWAPDSLEWESTGKGHSAIVEFLLSGGVAEFYADLRWPGWEADSEGLAVDQGLSAYPFAWSREGRGPNVSRRAAPLHEIIAVAEEAARQLRGYPDGTPFDITFT